MADHASLSTLSWDDLPRSAHALFHVQYQLTSGMDWAQEAWAHIERAGLAGYDNEIERAVVVVRFLALVQFYQDWWRVLDGEPLDTEWGVETDVDLADLDVNPFFIGQLVGREFLPEDESTIAGIVREALRQLIMDERGEVVGAVERGFGNTTSLFISLWRLRDPPEDDETEQDFIIRVVNSEITDDKSAAYEWLSSGARR